MSGRTVLIPVPGAVALLALALSATARFTVAGPGGASVVTGRRGSSCAG
ncbi:hypothetical protein LO771_21230 [Streptacidiphilus sp. ASG 303]|nr:hypothetical protein [Streptacidiphilus sp. ASG 303]MCD0484845.1 hypothetical protein [Streptacidiphilus sp. ASG 303]